MQTACPMLLRRCSPSRKNGELWDIGFGGGRLPPCTGSVPYQGLVEGETQVSVAGSMKKDGTLDICAEGTFVRILDTGIDTRHSNQIHYPTHTFKTNHRNLQIRLVTLNGRMLYKSAQKPSGNIIGMLFNSISLIQKNIPSQVIVNCPNAGHFKR